MARTEHDSIQKRFDLMVEKIEAMKDAGIHDAKILEILVLMTDTMIMIEHDSYSHSLHAMKFK